jgi:putative transposase
VPRTARVVAVAAPHHVTQRGNNRQQTFFTDAQRRYYLSLLAEQSRLHELRILGYPHQNRNRIGANRLVR